MFTQTDYYIRGLEKLNKKDKKNIFPKKVSEKHHESSIDLNPDNLSKIALFLDLRETNTENLIVVQKSVSNRIKTTTVRNRVIPGKNDQKGLTGHFLENTIILSKPVEHLTKYTDCHIEKIPL